MSKQESKMGEFVHYILYIIISFMSLYIIMSFVIYYYITYVRNLCARTIAVVVLSMIQAHPPPCQFDIYKWPI